MDFKVPELGEGIYEAELVAWHVKPGAIVKHGDVLAEVMTDKANMDMPSPFAGRIETLHAEPGDQIKVGQVILSYDADAGDNGDASAAEAQAQEPATTVSALKEATAPPPRAAMSEPAAAPMTKAAPPPTTTVKASPAVRHMARSLGVDLAQLSGSGPGGRILIEDVCVKRSDQGAAAPGSAAKPSAPTPAAPLDFDLGERGSTFKLRGVRRKVAEHMVQSTRSIPHYSYVDECDVTELVHVRDELQRADGFAQLTLTYLPFFVMAAAGALRDVPIINATFDEQNEQVTLHESINLGIAVATRDGLIVPVLRDADRKDVVTLARELEQLASRTRTGKATPADLRDGSFTITSIGSIGGLISTPIINHPQVAIMGIGRIIRRPVFDDAGNIKPAHLVYLSFSFDHRVVDGAIGAIFSNAIICRLTNPAALLLPMSP